MQTLIAARSSASLGLGAAILQSQSQGSPFESNICCEVHSKEHTIKSSKGTVRQRTDIPHTHMHLRRRLSPYRRLCPLPLFALRERVGAFEVAAERVLFLHLVDPDLRAKHSVRIATSTT